MLRNRLRIRALAEVMRLSSSSEPLTSCRTTAGRDVAHAGFIPVPVVHTIRGEVSSQLSQLYATYADRVSRRHQPATAVDASPAMRLAALIPDPVDLTDWPLETTKHDGVLWLWGLEPLSGSGELIRLVKDADLPLTLAGPVLRGQERWFDAEIAPHLSGHIRYVGTLDGSRRKEAISHARALLVLGGHYESQRKDMVHALASGTPVVVGRASEHDMVQHGVNGFLVDDDQEAIAALQDTRHIDPRVCRESALSRSTLT